MPVELNSSSDCISSKTMDKHFSTGSWVQNKDNDYVTLVKVQSTVCISLCEFN